MTTTQPRRSFSRRLTVPFRALRYLNWDPTGLGEALSSSARFPQADLAQAKQAHPAGKALAGV